MNTIVLSESAVNDELGSLGRVRKRPITVRASERFEDARFCIVRLAGIGAGSLSVGQEMLVKTPPHSSNFRARVLATSDKKLADLDDDDAEALLCPPDNSINDLRQAINKLYRFRPKWAGDDTLLRVIKLQRVT